MKRRNLSLAIWTAVLASVSSAVAGQAALSDVGFTVRTESGATVFHVGEVIPLQVATSLARRSADSYTISIGSMGPGGLWGGFNYEIEPAQGWDNPLQTYFESILLQFSILSSSQVLTESPVVVSCDLNEQIRFTVPGPYRVVVNSRRLHSETSGGEPKGNRVLRSNAIELTLIPATPEWQKATLRKAVEILNRTTDNEPRSPFEASDSEHRRAVATLRHLGTPGAAEAMAERLGDTRDQAQYKLGLISTPAREDAFKIMKRLLAAPDFEVNETFVDTIAWLAMPLGPSAGSSADRYTQSVNQWYGELTKALSGKRGRAQALSAVTVVNQAGYHLRELTQEDRSCLTRIFVQGFDTLSRSLQLRLLQGWWQFLDRDAMRPLLPRLVTSYIDPKPGDVNALEANELSGSALLRWWQMDPAGAKPTVIRELLSPHPRLGNDLPALEADDPLLEIEQHLARNLLLENGQQQQIASLLARYGTAAIEPQITDYLESRAGRLACATQVPLLAYLVRVDEVAALPILSRVLAAHGDCSRPLLSDVAVLHNRPVLQELAIRSLEDPDAGLAAAAAEYLGRYGTRSAEAALWAKLTDWSARWKGRADELGKGEEHSPSVTQAELGLSLVSALGSGQGWVLGTQQLARLSELSAMPNQQQAAKRFLEAANQNPKAVRSDLYQPGRFQIAQYRPASMEAAIEKLQQYPKHTAFVWQEPLSTDQQREAYRRLAAAAAKSGLHIELRQEP